MVRSPLALGAYGALLDPLFRRWVQHDSVDVDAGQVDRVGVDFTVGYNLLNLCDGDPPRHRDVGIEVACGAPKYQVTCAVCHPGFYQRHIGNQGALHQVGLAVEVARFLAFGHDGADPGGCEEGGDASATCTELFRERALRGELKLEFAGQILALKLFVFADVRRDHLTDLPGGKQQSKAKAIDAGIVGNAGEVAHARVSERGDQGFWNAAEAESAHGDHLSIFDDIGQRGACAREDFAHGNPVQSVHDSNYMSRFDDHHAHGHDDRHPGHGRRTIPSRGLGVACLIVLGFSALEIVVGLTSGSLALTSDGLHMLTDALALGLAWGAQWVARRPPDAQLTFGYERAESLAAFVNALTYLGLLGWIVVEAIDRFRVPHPLDASLALPVAVVGLLVNIAVWWALHRDGDDLNVRGALLHVLGDLAGSAIAITAIVVAATTGWTFVDPLLTLAMSLLLLISTVRLLRDSARVLMNATPPGLDLAALSSALAALPGVTDVHDLHVWNISSGQPALAAHLRLVDGADWVAVLEAARSMLSTDFSVQHVTLQPEFAKPI